MKRLPKSASLARALLCAAVALSAAGVSGAAWAAQSTTASTEVSFVADGQVSVTVPARIVCAVKGDGGLVCPDSMEIRNNGAWPVHVASVEAAPAEGFALETDGTIGASGQENAIWSSFSDGSGASFQIGDAAQEGGAVLATGFTAAAGGAVPLSMEGGMRNVDASLGDSAVDAYEVTWTVAAGERATDGE